MDTSSQQSQEKKQKYFREYYLNNREKLKLYQKQYKEANKDTIKAYNKIYHKKWIENKKAEELQKKIAKFHLNNQ